MRIWKAKASDKLGVITARERAAMEYRESLKERWKVDSEVNKVTRLVLYSFGLLHWLTFTSSVHPALAISQNQSTKLQNSNEQCWKLNGSKRREEENIHEKEKPIRNRRGRSWLSRNRAEIFLSGCFYTTFFSTTDSVVCKSEVEEKSIHIVTSLSFTWPVFLQQAN